MQKNILAIDTSSAYLSLALQVEDKIYKYIERVENKQSENIIPQIKNLLTEAKSEISQLKYIVYNQGPGSFTGLRIGLSVALGIAFGIQARLIPVPAFMSYALQAYELSGCKNVLVGLDARLNQLYFAGVNAQTLEYFIQPALINPADIVIHTEISADMVIIGSGFAEYKDKLLGKPVNNLDIITSEYPEATYLLKCANSGKFAAVAAANADLLYLRNKVALNLHEQQHKI